MRQSQLRNRFVSPLLSCCLALLCLVSQAVFAAEFCVNSNTGLNNALRLFRDGDEATIIRLVQGSYQVNDSYASIETDLTILGGYVDSSCSARVFNPALTRLTPLFSDGYNLVSGDMEISNLTFEGASSGGIALVGFVTTPNEAQVQISRVHFKGPTPNGFLVRGEEISVVDTLVTNAGGAPPSGFLLGCGLTIDGGNSDDFTSVLQSTITNNPGHGLCLTSFPGNYDAYLDNNIIYGNGTTVAGTVDLVINDTPDYIRRNNQTGSVLVEFAPTNPASSVNNLSTDPLFVNPVAADYRLQLGSPAVNSGTLNTFTALPALDIVGSPRVVGPRPDRGAYESSFDGSELLTVTSTSDSNAIGTLRWAINQANANSNYSIIRFNIPGACPKQIELSGPLPAITAPLGIDGYSQPGSSSNTSVSFATNAQPCIYLSGDQSTTNYGLHVPASVGATSYLGVSGMIFGDFVQASIRLEAGTGSVIYGNQFGYRLSNGALVGRSPIHVLVDGTASNTQIGGDDPFQRNLFAYSDNFAIALNAGSTGNRVAGNLIGLAPDGNSTTLAGNSGVGIALSGNTNTVENNALSGNNGVAIYVFEGSNNLIRNNTLGRKVGFFLCLVGGCDRDLSNGNHGVYVQGNSANDNQILSNTIANSAGTGIRATEGQRNAFFANKIWNSGQLGIDLGVSGLDPNDNDTSAVALAQPNRGINHPRLGVNLGGATIPGATGSALQGSVAGLFSSISSGRQYVLSAFVSDACTDNRSQAQHFIGSSPITTLTGGTPTNNGSLLFNFPVTSNASRGGSLVGRYVTVMATEFDSTTGLSHSSELSPCVQYTLSDDIFKNGFE